MTKCPLTGGVRLREVSVSGGSTVFTEPQTGKLNSYEAKWEAMLFCSEVNSTYYPEFE